MNDANEKHRAKGPPGHRGGMRYHCPTGDRPCFTHMSLGCCWGREHHVSPLRPPRLQTQSVCRAQTPVLRRVFFLTPFVVELEPESWCVATCDFRAPKLLLPMLSSSLGADWLLLLNITLTFLLFFLKIFQIFSKANPRGCYFHLPSGLRIWLVFQSPK